MLEVGRYGEVTQIKMSREWDGKPLYWVAAYLVDDVLPTFALESEHRGTNYIPPVVF